MDIAALSSVISQSKIRQDASMLVLKKVMNQSTEQMAKMMEASVSPHLGNNVDIRL